MLGRFRANYPYGDPTVLQKAGFPGHSIKIQPNTTVFGSPGHLIISLHNITFSSVLFSTNSRGNVCYRYASYHLSRPLALRSTLS